MQTSKIGCRHFVVGLWKTTELNSNRWKLQSKSNIENVDRTRPTNPFELDKWSWRSDQLPQKIWTIELWMRWCIYTGSFTMGALEDDRDAYVSERPRHMVTLTQGFWMGKCQ